MLDPRGTSRSANETPELMEDPEYLLCPSSIPVFTLDEQEWMVVCVEFISDADWSSEAFKGLVPAQEKKTHSRKLIVAHAKHEEGQVE
jgi:hypothetical protein